MLFAKSEGKWLHEKLTYRWEGNTGTVVKDRESVSMYNKRG